MSCLFLSFTLFLNSKYYSFCLNHKKLPIISNYDKCDSIKILVIIIKDNIPVLDCVYINCTRADHISWKTDIHSNTLSNN